MPAIRWLRARLPFTDREILALAVLVAFIAIAVELIER